MIAALYVETNGVYYGLDDVDPWDEERDARRYAGPWPVVAHPPCARWSRLAGFVEAVHGYKRGDDGGLFESALAAVHRFGGVLEHPAYSAAWARYDLPRPNVMGGWYGSLLAPGHACYIEQGRYGLPVKKATWLYAYGVEFPDLLWGYTPDGEGEPRVLTNGYNRPDQWRERFHWQRDGRWIDGAARRVTAAEGRQRGAIASRTPPAFRDILLAMARSVRFEDAPEGRREVTA